LQRDQQAAVRKEQEAKIAAEEAQDANTIARKYEREHKIAKEQVISTKKAVRDAETANEQNLRKAEEHASQMKLHSEKVASETKIEIEKAHAAYKQAEQEMGGEKGKAAAEVSNRETEAKEALSKAESARNKLMSVQTEFQKAESNKKVADEEVNSVSQIYAAKVTEATDVSTAAATAKHNAQKDMIDTQALAEREAARIKDDIKQYKAKITQGELEVNGKREHCCKDQKFRKIEI